MLTWSSSSRIIQFIKKVKTWILWLSQYPPPFDTLGGVQNSECIEGFSIDTHYFRVVLDVSFGLFCHSFRWYMPPGEKDKISSGPVQQKKHKRVSFKTYWLTEIYSPLVRNTNHSLSMSTFHHVAAILRRGVSFITKRLGWSTFK